MTIDPFPKLILLLALLLTGCAPAKRSAPATQPNLSDLRKEFLAQDNLIPWSIVAFDSQERDPRQRVSMVKELGFRRYAFGGRAGHIARFEEEVEIARAENIAIDAVWLYINPNKDRPGRLKPQSEQLFRTLEQTGLQTQIWVGFHPKFTEGLTQAESLAKSTTMIRYLCERADSVGSKVALYNHGGWFGEPDNQLAIIDQLPQFDIGIVYNFHHGHGHLNTYSEFIDRLLPHLWCVNLNGMRAAGPKILTIGAGELEKDMIDELLLRGYRGPFGILGHVKGGDAAEILQHNLEGLRSLGDKG